MKKFLAPLLLFVVAAGVAAYLFLDFSKSKSSFNAEAYLSARAQIDSLQIALWEAKDKPTLQVKLREELNASWEVLNDMRTVPEIEKEGSFSQETILWITGGVFVVILCIGLLVGIIGKKKEIPSVELKPTPRPKKRSIIDDLEQTERPPLKVEFEDENGVVENKILTTDLNATKPQLRPTAKERITSAMQSLSDVLKAPKGLSREYTMKIRAQSHNLTGDPNLKTNSPLKTSKFDRALIEKNKILQMSRRGFPASAIASQLKISQEQVEEIVKNAMESGS